ncbi:hypothetical protein CFC21_070612 [Triticum aestivum]|uniref:Uncharacterized protein n=2 Tax=Triticum aestivum TaxID=4565 RepID=A0A3B6LIE7_WHEAT|nr:hypothetical protein CFC21_070612 [Triticum aestivum]
MADARNKFTQPDKDTPFGRHLKEVTRYLNIVIPRFTGTYIATLIEEERWMIRVQVPGRTFMPVTEPIEFSFDAPTWSLGKSMAAHITMGRIEEVYHKDLKDTIYQICGRRDEQWEMISTRRDRSIAACIQELNQHIRRQENQMCAGMIDLKKEMTRILELEEELKSTRDGYEEEMTILVEKNDDLMRKLGVFMRDPTPGGEDDDSTCPENYIIINDTDSDPDDSDDDYVDEAGADIMESSTD